MRGSKMRIKVRNLGVIDEAEITLKPLTILIGPNNAGKTWLAYLVASILGPYGWAQYSNAYFADQVRDVYPILDEAIDRVLDGGDATIDLVQFIEESGEEYVNNIAAFARQWMRDYMSTALVNFENLEVRISLEEVKEEAKKEVVNYSMNRKFGVGRGKRRPLLNAVKEPGSTAMYVYTSTEEDTSEKPPRSAIKEFVAGNTFEEFRRAFFSDKVIFPAERTTYITYPFDGEEIKLKGNLASDRPLNERRGRLLNGAISSFLSMIHNTYLMSLLDKKEREEEARNNEAIDTYMHLARLLEDIMGGSLYLPDPEPGLQRQIIFQTTNNVALEIPIASSMVKELSSLVLYLRYFSELGDWLIIDEPEMNLHPEAQVKMMEFLTILVNAGLRVLITTHSPNMVDHLENLIRAAEHDEEDQISIASEFFLHRSDAFILQEDVSIYLVDQGRTGNILKEGKINWGTFADVSDRVARIHYQL
jgi:AAA ATPase domain